jgi:hypothetical protein
VPQGAGQHLAGMAAPAVHQQHRPALPATARPYSVSALEDQR